MKRYQLAKKEGLNWQSVIVQDLETDLKVYVLNAVRKGIGYSKINETVSKMINTALKDVDSDQVKSMVKSSLYLYASRVYVQAFAIYGNQELGAEIMLLLKRKGVIPTETFKNYLLTLEPAYNRAVPNNIYNADYEKEVIHRTNRLLDSTAKVDYSEYTSLRASVEKQIRWEYHEKNLQDLKDKGTKLVWIDSHANCSERCRDWQGRLYSLNNTIGEVDGIGFVPLERATDIYTTTKAGKTYKNGCISGFGCRHKLVAYRQGFKPQTIPESVTKKQYAIDRKMRELERKVRLYESRALGYKGYSPKLYKLNKTERNKAMQEYVAFAEKNNVPYYPSRVDI